VERLETTDRSEFVMDANQSATIKRKKAVTTGAAALHLLTFLQSSSSSAASESAPKVGVKCTADFEQDIA